MSDRDEPLVELGPIVNIHGIRREPRLLSHNPDSDVALAGDHGAITRWRRESLRRTLEQRPDPLERAALSEEDRRALAELNKG